MSASWRTATIEAWRGHGEWYHLVGLGMIISSQMIFGSMGLFYKFALAGGASSLTILALRFPLASLALWLLILATGRRVRLPRDRVIGLVAMGGACYVGQSYLYLAALEYLPLSTTTLIQVMHPAIVTAAALAMGRERATAARLGALALSLVGAALVAGSPAQGGSLIGLGLAICSPLVYSTYLLLGDRVLRGVDPLIGSGYITAAASVGFVLLALVFHDFSLAITTSALLSIFTIAWFCTVFGVTGLLAGLPRVGASAASIAGMLEPATSVALAVLVLGERLSPGSAIGGVCVLVAVFLLRTPTARGPRPAPPARGQAAGSG